MTRVGRFKKGVAVVLATLLVLTTLPGGLLKVQAANSHTTLDISKGSIVFGDGTVTQGGVNLTHYNSNGYIITQSGNSTAGNYIMVNGGNQNITLRNVHISEPIQNNIYYDALEIRSGKTNLTVSGDNSLTGAELCSGIGVLSGASLVIDGGKTDSLAVTGKNQPGIGSPYVYGGGDVTINGGRITAIGGGYSAGIGGHTQSQCNNVTINGGVVTAYGSGGGAGIGGGGGNPSYMNGGSGGNVKINGGKVTATGSNGSCGIGGGAGYYGALAAAGSVTITGGSVNAAIQSTPANADGTPLYRTTVSVPSGTDVNNLIIRQNGILYNYGCTDMQTDGASYGKLCLWLPANAGNEETTASVSTDNSNVYSGYHHTVDNSNNSVLKMDQSLTIQSVLASYTYNPMGSLFTPTVMGGAADITGTITYSGTNSLTGALITGSSIQPTDVGCYTVTITKAENAAWYSGSTSQNFSIEPEDLSDDSRITIGSIPNQLYDAKEAATPAVTIKDSNIGIDNSYYSVSYLNNTGIALSNGENPPTAKIDGSGNYRGTVYARFTIESAPTISVSGNLGDWATQVELTVSARGGSSGIGSVTVQKGTDMPTDITTNKNYMVTENGSYTFTVTSNSGFTDFQTVQVEKIDSAAPAVGNISGNPESPVQSAALSLTVVPGESGIRSVTVSRYGNGQWTVLTDASITDIKNANDSHTYIYATTGNGSYKFMVTSGAGVSADSSVDVTNIDTAKPEVSIDSNGYNDGDWTKDDVTLNVSNTTFNLGTTKFEYSTDGTNWTTFNGSLTDSAEGITAYSFRATSASGLVSDVQSITVKIDKTAPTEMAIRFKQNPFKAVARFLTFGIFFGDTVDVNFSATDKGSGIDYYEYQTVAEGGTTGTSWQAGALSISPEFKGTIHARAVDKAGNVSGTVAKALVVDKTAPAITANNGSATLNTTDKNASIPVTVTDNGAGVGTVNYQVNDTSHTANLTDANYSDVTSTYSFSIGNLPDGSYDVVVNAQDNSGNAAATATVHVIKNAAQTGFGFASGTFSRTYGDAPFTVAANGGQSDGAVTYAITSGTNVLRVDTATGKVSIQKAGTAVITATKAGNNGYRQATAKLTVNVSKATPKIQTLPTASDITAVGKLSSVALKGGEGSVAGLFEWTNPDTVVSKDGDYEVTFTPASSNYSSCICKVPVKVTPVITNSGTGVQYDLSGANLPDGVTSVSVHSSVVSEAGSGSSAYSVVNKLIDGSTSSAFPSAIKLYNLSLLDQGNQAVTGFTGKIAVRIPIPDGMSGDLHVYWYNNADGTVTDMNAKKENGYLVFETTHFSYYAVAELSTQNTGSNPNTGDNNSASSYWSLIALPAALATALAVKRKRFRLKRKV